MIEKIFSKDAVMLAIVTALAYFYAFVYEFGYIHNFGVPVRLEVVTTQSVLLVCSALLIAIIAYGDTANTIFDFSAYPKFRYVLIGIYNLQPVIFAAVFLAFFDMPIWLKLFCTIIIAVVLYYLVIRHILSQKNQGGYLIAAKRLIDDLQTMNTLSPRLRTFFGPDYFGFALVSLIVFPVIAILLGVWTASSQRSFLTAERDGTWLYVTGNQDQMIFSGFDAGTNSLNGRVLILRGKELEALSLRNILLPEPPKHW